MEAVFAASRITNSQWYPARKRFEEMRAVACDVIPQQGKPERRQCHLTRLGEEVLHDLLMGVDGLRSRCYGPIQT